MRDALGPGSHSVPFLLSPSFTGLPKEGLKRKACLHTMAGPQKSFTEPRCNQKEYHYVCINVCGLSRAFDDKGAKRFTSRWHLSWEEP